MCPTKIMFRVCFFLPVIFCTSIHADFEDMLSIEETLAIARQRQIDGIKREHHPDAWRGNPAARNLIYEQIENGEWVPGSPMISYIGTIGDESDIPRLLALIPESNKMLGPEDMAIAGGVFAALARLSNRGYVEAGNILAGMTRPTYWEKRKVGVEGCEEPYAELAFYVFPPYAFAGREDAEQLLGLFLKEKQIAQVWVRRTKSLREFFKATKLQEQQAGTWRVQSRPASATMKSADAAVAAERGRKQQYLRKLFQNAIDNLLTKPEKILASDIIDPDEFHDYFRERAEEIFAKVKEKERDTDMYKEIACLGLFPRIAEVDAIVDYIDSLPKMLTDTDRKLLAACLLSLGMLAESGDGQAQNFFSTKQAEGTSYWASRGINIYGNAEVPDDSLTSVNALILASFVSYNFWMADHKTPERVAEYLNYIGVEGVQRQIMEDALLTGLFNHVTFYDPSLEARGKSRYGEWVFTWRVFDYILKILTPPVTGERLITPSP